MGFPKVSASQHDDCPLESAGESRGADYSDAGISKGNQRALCDRERSASAVAFSGDSMRLNVRAASS